jgi:hypothetical protein
MTSRKKKIRVEHERLEEERRLRNQGLRPAETEKEREDRLKIAHTVWLMDAHAKKNRGEPWEDFVPDQNQEVGQKRKNVGRTFAVPEDDSDGDDTPSSPERTPRRRLLTPRSPLKKGALSNTPQLPPPQFSQLPQPSQPPRPPRPSLPEPSIIHPPSPPRVGRTFAVPEDSGSEISEYSVRDSDMMSVDVAPWDMKRVVEWTQDDYEGWLKIAYGFDPTQLAKEVSKMEAGAVPDMFLKAHWAILAMRQRAKDELAAEMKAIREEEVEKLRRQTAVEIERLRSVYNETKDQLELEFSEEQEALREEYMEFRKRRALIKAHHNGTTLREGVDETGHRGNNEYGYPYSSPDQSSYLENVFAMAETNAAKNVEAAGPTDADRNTPPTPSPAHAELPSNAAFTPLNNKDTSTMNAAKPNVTWSENVIHNHAVPGPNEPIKPNTPLPKSALKGRQLESLERKMSEATRYTPKQPSRLREVSDVPKPAASPVIPSISLDGIQSYLKPRTRVSIQYADLIASMSDQGPKPQTSLWGSATPWQSRHPDASEGRIVQQAFVAYIQAK